MLLEVFGDLSTNAAGVTGEGNKDGGNRVERRKWNDHMYQNGKTRGGLAFTEVWKGPSGVL